MGSNIPKNHHPEITSLGPLVVGGPVVSRRSFLKHTSQTALYCTIGGSFPGAVALAAGQDEVFPESLGRSFWSAGKIIGVPVADFTSSMPKYRPEGFQEWDVRIAISRSDYAKNVSGTARAKFGGGMLGGEAKASSSRSFRSEKNTVHLVAWKKTVLGRYTLDEPTLRAEVANEDSGWRFAERYGDQLIDRVTMGGELVLIYELEFSSEYQARQFSAAGSGRYKAISAAAAIHSAVTSNAKNATVSLRGFASGVRAMPTLISGGRLVHDDSGVKELLQFWDEFDKLVVRDSVPAVVEVRPINIGDVRGANVALDIAALRRFEKAIDRCEVIDDTIDERLSSLRYLRKNCLAWNTHVTEKAISEREETLALQEDILLDWVRPRMKLQEAQSFDDHFSAPLSSNAITTIPDDWICRDLIKAIGWSLNFNGRNTPVNIRQALPARLIPEQHIQLVGNVTKYGNDPFVDGILKFDTGEVIFNFGQMRNHSQNVDPIARVPLGARSIILTGTTYGKDPLIVNISIMT